MRTHTYVEHALREKARKNAHVGTALTIPGFNWAIDNRDESLVARVALMAVSGVEHDWPHEFCEVAIAACNAAT